MPVHVDASAQDAARRAAALRRLVGTVAAACLTLLLAGCAVVQRDVPRPETHAWADPAQKARASDDSPVAITVTRSWSTSPSPYAVP